tara:strand:+ start:560 stop:1237 length:678 start_codon:yes stop_codon:yes gene_type:complete
MKDKISFENLVDTFPKEWIDGVYECYHKNITDNYQIDNKGWFVKEETRLGRYGGRNDDYIPVHISDYFKRLLYGSNIFCLDYVVKNKEEFSNLLFCDAGCGFGLLSCFINKIKIDGLEVYNYDTFQQLGNYPDQFPSLNTNEFYVQNKINSPTTNYPTSCDILYCADVTTSMNKIMSTKPKFIMLEHWYTEISSKVVESAFQNMSNYDVVADYGPLLRVYKTNEK